MKRILAILLSLVMISTQTAVFADGGAQSYVDVGYRAAVFAYGSQSGTEPYMAVDGNLETAWISSNNTPLCDYLIFDLSKGYTISSLKITLAQNVSSNFTVYGANDAKFADKTALTAKLEGLVSGVESTVDTILSDDEFRYIIFEQDAAETSFGFSNIEILTADANAHTPVGFVRNCAESKPAVVATNIIGRYERPAGALASFGSNTTDASPVTAYTWTHNNNADGAMAMLDLGSSQKLSHVAFQMAVTNNSGSVPYAQDFYIVASDDSACISLEKCKILVNFSGSAAHNTVANGLYDTGLLVFEVPDEFKDTSFRYIGIYKKTIPLRMGVNTLQAYKKLVTEESSVVSDSEVSYSISKINESVTPEVTALFGHYNASGKLSETGYADAALPTYGTYGDMNFDASAYKGESGIWSMANTDGKWDLAIVDGKLIIDYISDLNTLTRPAEYSFTNDTSTVEFKQSGIELSARGSVDAGVIGIVILKPGKDFAHFTAEDIYAHRIITAPQGSSGAWDFDVSYSMPDDATPNDYKVGIISDTGVLADASFTLTVFDMEAIIATFADITEGTAMDLFTQAAHEDIQMFFGEDLVNSLVQANQRNHTMGKSIMIAKDGMTSALFDTENTSWLSITTITAALKASLIVDAVINNDNVSGAIDSYSDAMPVVFGDENYNETEFEAILPTVVEALNPDTAEELSNAFKRTFALSLITDGTLAEKEKAITDYSDELGISDETLDTEITLRAIADELNSSASYVVSNYAGGMDDVIKGIVEDLEGEVPSSEQLGHVTPNIGGFVGGGISIGSPSSKDNDDKDTGKEDAEKEDVKKEDKTDEENTVADAFTDIGNFSWAHDAINVLTKRNIISGVGEGKFNPEGLLTREQTVKLLVLTLNLPTNQNSNGYKDCAYGAWYYPYITAAKTNKLVNGVSKAEFGIGTNVSRQDIAVMIYRALKERKLLDTKSTMEFSDHSLVADYAKDAVSTLGGMGLITGFGDGNFAPKQNATRAEAAVIFARLLEIIEKAEEVAQ